MEVVERGDYVHETTGEDKAHGEQQLLYNIDLFRCRLDLGHL